MRGFVVFIANGKGGVYKEGSKYPMNAKIAEGYAERGWGVIEGTTPPKPVEVEEVPVEVKQFKKKK
jgi:hypothetical protein